MASLDAGPVVAIVGAGFSGTLLASQLLKQGRYPLRLLLIDRTGRFGPGLAFGTTDPSHLLNVSAGAMSAWPEDSSHLLRWLEHNRAALSELLPHAVDVSTFLPRSVYGLYLQSILEEAEAEAPAHVTLQRISSELTDVEPLAADGSQGSAGFSHRLTFTDHPSLLADQVVLAVGNSAWALRPSPGPVRHGWHPESTAALDPQASVVLLGTGLTMVDVVMSLEAQGHRGPILALSRRGLRPNAHGSVRPLGCWLDPEQAPTRVLPLWRLIRGKVQKGLLDGQDWRAVIDGLRPTTSRLWARLSDGERRRFLRHASVVWDVHRHRIAPELDARLEALLQSRRLSIRAGRLLSHAVDGTALKLKIRYRSSPTPVEMRADRLILCSGIPLDYRCADVGLISRLRQRGLLHADCLGLGARCDDDGGLLDGAGRPQATLHLLGSPRKGQLWESIAVPELRLQARDLARRLLAFLPTRLQTLRQFHDDPAHSHSTIAEERRLNQPLANHTCKVFIQAMEQPPVPPLRTADALSATVHLDDLQPSEPPAVTGATDRQIHNDFLGMFI